MKSFCCNCGSTSCGYGHVVQIASDDLLLTREYYLLIWKALSELGLNRRQTVEELIDLFCWSCCVEYIDAKGDNFELPEFESILPDDKDCTWFGRFLEPNDTGCKSRRYYNANRYKGGYLPLLRLLDIAAKLLEPEPFRKIGQVC